MCHGARGNAAEVERTEQVVVLRERPLALEDPDCNGCLVVGVGREGLLPRYWHSGIARDEGRHVGARRLDTERERRDIEKQDVVDCTASGLILVRGQEGGLDRRPVGDSLVGVDVLAELAAVEEVPEHLLDLRDTRGPTDKNNVVDVVLSELGIAENAINGVQALTEEVNAKILELRPCDVSEEVYALEKRLYLDRRLLARGKSALSALTGSAQATHRPVATGDILPVLLLKLGDEVVHDARVEVLAAQVSVASRGLDLKDAGAGVDSQEGDIERPTTEVKDEDVALLLGRRLVEPIGDGSGSGLVDDAEDVKPSNRAGVLRSLALRIREVRRDGDDGLGDLVAEVVAGDILHLGEDHGGDLLGSERLRLTLVDNLDLGLLVGAADDLEREVLEVCLHFRVVEPATDQALGVEDGILRIEGALVLGGVADETLCIREGDVGGRGVRALLIGDDLHFFVLINANAGVSGSEVDAYSRCSCHDFIFPAS